MKTVLLKQTVTRKDIAGNWLPAEEKRAIVPIKKANHYMNDLQVKGSCFKQLARILEQDVNKISVEFYDSHQLGELFNPLKTACIFTYEILKLK